MAVALAFLVAAVLRNWAMQGVDESPVGDFAADILYTQSRHFQLLLTGHHSLHGVRHPGPFYMLVRVMGEYVLGNRVGSILISHRFAVMAVNACLLGLFAALIHCYGRSRGATRWVSFAAATAAASSVSFLSFLLDGLSLITGLFIPTVISLPMLTLMVGAMPSVRDRAAGLLAASFSFAVLVHAYIPMPLIAGPIWLTAVLAGHRDRVRRTGAGFSHGVWLGVAGIAGLFLAPLILDAVTNWPGNILRILSASDRLSAHEDLEHTLTILYSAIFRRVHRWGAVLLISLMIGLGVTVWRWGYRREILTGTGICTLLGVFTLIFFSLAPAPTFTYMAGFLRNLVLFPVSFCLAIVVVELSRSCRRWVAGGCILLFLLALAMIGEVRPVAKPLLHRIAAQIAADAPNGSAVALSVVDVAPKPANRYPWPPTVIAGLMLSLDRLGVFACHPNQYFAYYFTPWRICGPTASLPTYGVEALYECEPEVATTPLEELRLGDLGRLHSTICVRVSRIGAK